MQYRDIWGEYIPPGKERFYYALGWMEKPSMHDFEINENKNLENKLRIPLTKRVNTKSHIGK